MGGGTRPQSFRFVRRIIASPTWMHVGSARYTLRPTFLNSRISPRILALAQLCVYADQGGAYFVLESIEERPCVCRGDCSSPGVVIYSRIMSRSSLEPDIASHDAELISRLRSGDAAAFESMVRMYGPRMLAVARRFMRDEDDAADALQDAFLSAFRSIDRFAGESQLATWLHRIVVNACLMRLRRRKVSEVSIDSLLPQFQEDGHQIRSSTEWPSSSAALERYETRQLVRQLIDQLPDAYREVLLLRDIDEIETDEVAQLMGISEGAVKVRLHRARQSLRSLLDPYMKSEQI